MDRGKGMHGRKSTFSSRRCHLRSPVPWVEESASRSSAPRRTSDDAPRGTGHAPCVLAVWVGWLVQQSDSLQATNTNSWLRCSTAHAAHAAHSTGRKARRQSGQWTPVSHSIGLTIMSILLPHFQAGGIRHTRILIRGCRENYLFRCAVEQGWHNQALPKAGTS